MARKPVVAGMFYAADSASLRSEIEECFLGPLGPGTLPRAAESRAGKITGLVCPHAGYVYSGSAAAYSYLALAEDGMPDIAIIMGPNHTGLGAAVSVSTETEWATPLGNVAVDVETAGEILRNSRYAEPNDAAHSREHSIEVQLPFLQYLGGDTSIVPIVLAHLNPQDALELASDLGEAIAAALRNRSGVIIASTDFTHYESKSSAQAKDSRAIDAILRLDSTELIKVVDENAISMCGVVGVAVMIEAAKALGAKSARKLAYYTSGDVTGDTDQVVGYGAIAVEKGSEF